MTVCRRRLCPIIPLLVAAVGCSDGSPSEKVGKLDGLMVINTNGDTLGSVVNLVDPLTKTVPGSPCLTSANQGGELIQPLSGSLGMPSHPFPGVQALIFDRTYGTLTWLETGHCDVTSQYSVSWKELITDPATGATRFAYPATPRDAVLSSQAKLYVTRQHTNPAPTADPSDLDEGGDVYVLNYRGTGTPSRIDLAPYALPTEDGIPTLPFPDRMLIVGESLYVTLNNRTADLKDAGPSRIVVVNLPTDTVVGTIDLPGLKGCGILRAVEGHPQLLVTACGAFAAEPDPIAVSGVAWIDLSTVPPTVSTVPAAAFGAPVSSADLAVVDASHGFVLVPGSGDDARPDAIWAFGPSVESPAKIHTGLGTRTLAGLVFHAATKTLFVADANPTLPGILPFDLTIPTIPTPGTVIDSDPDYHLSPRDLAVW